MADGTLKVGTITTSSGSGTITLGQSGETVNVSGTAGTGFGKILQAVQAIQSTEITTTSTSYVTTNCEASITPSSTSNKVLIMIAGSGRQNVDGNTAKYTVYKDDTTDLCTSDKGFSEISVTGGTFIKTPYVITFLDSPSTTSSVKYSLYMKNQNSSGGCRACHNNTDTTVTLMEIAG
jgi:hypothetical protein